jgi:hypothetical protein
VTPGDLARLNNIDRHAQLATGFKLVVETSPRHKHRRRKVNRTDSTRRLAG